ncbi:MAG: hypothetical protein A2008_00310 [Candidatus Wallbacteria bacterium GWC2_49_35]|uniref:Phosphate-binding protein n=1 Tax=Candidatus Wallbacteria bacterium GWC2_49_35 TaxID=1817813 RepID=A0A1F7WFW4_9BACT|nr:MAG: hypothetical protein A2008_00310 [Candidatus Wallbacteria bacterium GWC2_49_35]HBC74658.1 phosphate-binding protein [Candidatus Wallbacteria bacterium]
MTSNTKIKKHLINSIIAVSAVLLFMTPGAAHASGESRKLMIAGSTSVQPIAEKLAEHFMHKHPGIKIEVQGGGSSAGVQAAYSGAADIGMSSRELKPEEKQLKEFVVAYDAIVLIVHRDNAIENISREDIKKIFAFDITSWNGVSGSNNKGVITVLTREDGSGTRGAFEELIMGTAEIAARALVQDSTGSIREIVSNDIDGLGYISFGSLNERVKALAVDGVKPEMKTFQAKDDGSKYKVIRPFLLLTREEPAGAAKEFMNFIRSTEGVELIKKEGLVPAL